MTPDPSRALASRALGERTGRTPSSSANWRDYRERGSARLLRVMAFLSLRLGRSLSRSVLYGIAAYFFLFSPAASRHSRRFLKLALGRNPTAADRFRHILYFATCIHDRVYLINEQFDRFDCTIEGEPLVRAQIDAGRGGFLVGAHMGSFEVMASMGRRQRGLQVSMAMYENNARKISSQP
jgi:predicted LPLAT superfamily acyltransferase